MESCLSGSRRTRWHFFLFFPAKKGNRSFFRNFWPPSSGRDTDGSVRPNHTHTHTLATITGPMINGGRAARDTTETSCCWPVNRFLSRSSRSDAVLTPSRPTVQRRGWRQDLVWFITKRSDPKADREITTRNKSQTAITHPTTWHRGSGEDVADETAEEGSYVNHAVGNPQEVASCLFVLSFTMAAQLLLGKRKKNLTMDLPTVFFFSLYNPC